MSLFHINGETERISQPQQSRRWCFSLSVQLRVYFFHWDHPNVRMGQRQIRLLLSVWIIGCVATEEERKFSVTIDTVQVNEGDRAEPSASSGHQIQVKEENHEEETTKVEPNDLRTVPRTLHTDSPDELL